MRVGRFLLMGLAVASVGCKLKMEATPTGMKPGAPDTVIVHVKTEKGVDLTCSQDWCSRTVVPAGGEVDLEVKIPSTTELKTVFVNGKKGPRKAQALVDLVNGVPPVLAVTPSYGTISCEPRKCSGLVQVAPAPTLSLSAPGGSVVEIGTQKLTVPAEGFLEAPLTLTPSTPFKSLPLAKVCVGLFDNGAASPALASTSMTITFPDKKTSTAKVDFDMASAERGLSAFLANVEKGPALFAWEKPGAAAAGKRAAVYVSGDHCYDAGAAGATVADLDVVALAESKDRVGECVYELTGETTGRSAGTATGKITMHDLAATAYDRITGKKLGTRLFVAPKSCTRDLHLTSATSSIADQSSFPDYEAVAKWAATLAR